MASTTWLHQRFWCGQLPLFHLLADDELQRELDASVYYFGSSELASLRTQIRLKLIELPLIHQTRRSAATYANTLELLRKYLPYLLAIRQFVDTSSCPTEPLSPNTEQPQASIDSQLQAFPPLFYGVHTTADRVVGREQRVEHTVGLDLALTLFAMAQLQALYAEAQVEQAMRLQSSAMVQIGEQSWQDASTLFAQSAAFADSARRRYSPGDSHLGSLLQFASVTATTARALGEFCVLHNISARVFCLTILDESSERLARAVSVYARRAVGVVRRSAVLLETMHDTDFRSQLAWLLTTYETRWLAVHYSCEQTVFELDFYPEIALSFHDAILRLRLAPLPSYSHRHDTFFTRIAQELQLVHHAHLNRAMADKRALMDACQRKLGVSYSAATDGWTKANDDELLTVRALDPLDPLDLGTVCSTDQDSDERTQCLVQGVCEAHKLATRERLEVIATSVKRPFAQSDIDEHVSASDASLCGARDNASEARQRQQMLTVTLAVDTNTVVNSAVTLTTPSGRAASDTVAAAASKATEKQASGPHATASIVNTGSLKTLAAASTAPFTLLDTLSVKKRPSSAQLPMRESSASSPQCNTGWVTMVVGGKTLHFESAAAISGAPRAASASPSSAHRRNAVSLVDIDATPNAVSSRAQRSNSSLRARPSSSPSYLMSRTATASSHTDEHVLQHKTPMWVPMRAQCALCERRFMRSHLAGVVLMKRIFDLRRKWGMVMQDSKKFCAASALYAKAQVCLLCQEILQHEDECSLQAFSVDHESDPTALQRTAATRVASAPIGDDVGILIFTSVMRAWHQQPHEDDVHMLEDVALNKRARQSSTVFDMDARNAVQTDAMKCAHTREELQPWWEVDLANYHVIHSVKIWLRDEPSHRYNIGSDINSTPFSTSSCMSTSAVQQQQRKSSLRPIVPFRPTRLQHLGMFPLHISISMKTGAGRDLDDILASCVSRHCVEENATSPIVWHAPPNSRGRFVRIQAERLAVLHIERVHVYIASTTRQQQLAHACHARKQTLRQQLKRAAFRASVLVNPSSARESGDNIATDKQHSALVSAFLNPEQAEKKRLSRLYSRFKGVLDARSKYMLEEVGVADAQRRHQQQQQNDDASERE